MRKTIYIQIKPCHPFGTYNLKEKILCMKIHYYVTENILYSPCQREKARKKQTLWGISLPTSLHTYTDTCAKSMGCRTTVSALCRTHILLSKSPHQPLSNYGGLVHPHSLYETLHPNNTRQFVLL